MDVYNALSWLICQECYTVFDWSTVTVARNKPGSGEKGRYQGFEYHCCHCDALLRWLFVLLDTGEVFSCVDYFLVGADGINQMGQKVNYG